MALLVTFAVSAQEPMRQQRLTSPIFGLGPGGISNLGSKDDLSYNVYAGGLWEVNRYTAIRAQGEATTNSEDNALLSGLVGANIYPFRGDITPYFGGDVGLGWGTTNQGDGFGVDLGGLAGVLLFPDQEIPITVEAQAHVLFNDNIAGSNSNNFPWRYSGRVGILF
jgi:hypothetical protein